jgi:hypothetical protein
MTNQTEKPALRAALLPCPFGCEKPAHEWTARFAGSEMVTCYGGEGPRRHNAITITRAVWQDRPVAAQPAPPTEATEAREWPDIGPDPMQGDRSDRYNVSAAACREAYVRQQPHVPDQTALVWRWHLGALLEEHLRLNVLLSRVAPTEATPPHDGLREALQVIDRAANWLTNSGNPLKGIEIRAAAKIIEAALTSEVQPAGLTYADGLEAAAKAVRTLADAEDDGFVWVALDAAEDAIRKLDPAKGEGK